MNSEQYGQRVLAVEMADEYLSSHRKGETWRLIDMLRDEVVRLADAHPDVCAAVKRGQAEAWREGFQEGYCLEPRPDWANAPEGNPYRENGDGHE